MCMLRTDDTDEDVDFRPPRPERRRYEFDLGVRGVGERDSRLTCARVNPPDCVDPLDDAVESRGRFGTVDRVWSSGRGGCSAFRNSMICAVDDLRSCTFALSRRSLLTLPFLEDASDLLRRAGSLNQALIVAS